MEELIAMLYAKDMFAEVQWMEQHGRLFLIEKEDWLTMKLLFGFRVIARYKHWPSA